MESNKSQVSLSSNSPQTFQDPSKSLKKEKQQASELLCKRILLIYFILFLPLFYNIYDFNAHYLYERFPDEPHQQKETWHLDVFFFSLVTEALLRSIAGRVFKKTALGLMEEKPKGWDKNFTADKMCKWTCDFFYYGGLSVAEIILLKNTKWIPKELFGYTEYKDLKYFDHWPRSPDHMAPCINYIYAIQLAHHTYTLGYQIFVQRHRDPKFWEYLLHHFLAYTLMLVSLCMRWQPSGLMILLTHDIGDAVLALGRAYSEFKIKTKTFGYSIMTLAIFSWVYCRCYLSMPLSLREIYGFYISRETFTDHELYRFLYVLTYLVTMMLLLIPMTLYWIFYMLKYAYSTLVKKKVFNHYEHKGSGCLDTNSK